MRLLKQSVVAVVIAIVNCSFILTMASQLLRAPEWKEKTDASSNSYMKNITKGAELKLSCAVKGHPRPDVHVLWYRNDVALLTNLDKMKLKAHNLRLTDIQPSDEGNYTCSANNSAGKIEFTFIVDVKEAPEWKEDTDPYSNSSMKSVMERTELKLSCPAKGDPKPHVLWLKDGANFMPNADKIKVKGHVLKFSGIQTSDRGNYSCVAHNSVGKIAFTFIVNVTEYLWPLVVNVSEKLTVHEGEDAKFYCIVLNDKTAKIQWLRMKPTDDTEARDLRIRDQSSDTLVISRVTKDDGGQYACLVGNQHGSKYLHMHLTVLEVTTTTTTTTTTPTTTMAAIISTTTTVEIRPTGIEKYKTDTIKPKKKNSIKNKYKKEKRKKNKNKKDSKYDDEDLDDINEVDISTAYPVNKDEMLGKGYGIWKTFQKKNFNVITNMYEPTPPNMGHTFSKVANEDNNSPDAMPGDGDVENIEKNNYSNIDARNVTANVSSASSGGISVWTVYIIVGAIAGGLLLTGLVAIAIALFCQYRHNDESQYKSSSV